MNTTVAELFESVKDAKNNSAFPTIEILGIVGKLGTICRHADDPSRWRLSINVDPECVWFISTWSDVVVKTFGSLTTGFATGLCPKCGDAGEWRSLALVCRAGHGVFAG